MDIGLITLALAALAGTLTLLNPCVLPLLPVVVGAATSQTRAGLVALAAGMVIAFTLTGVVITSSGHLLGIEGSTLRYGAAILMIGFGLVLVSPALQCGFTQLTSGLGDRAGSWLDAHAGIGMMGQFSTGALLGLVWTPCVGPTLGAAIGLAAQGRALAEATLVMAIFSLFAIAPLLAIGLVSRARFQANRERLLRFGERGRRWMGWGLLLIGVLVLTGGDKWLESAALDIMPEWLVDLTVSF